MPKVTAMVAETPGSAPNKVPKKTAKMMRMNILGANTTDRPLVNRSSISCHLLLETRDKRLDEKGKVAQRQDLAAGQQHAQENGEADVQDDGDDKGSEEQHRDVPLA